jgi:fatty acid desaturase
MQINPSKLQSLDFYRKALKDAIPEEAWKPNPRRLWTMGFHVLFCAFCVREILLAESYWLKAGFSILMGHSFAILYFLAHEILHGSVVKNRFWTDVLAGICVLPYGWHPQVWAIWHNRVHHAFTNDGLLDPDTFGSVARYKSNRYFRLVEPLTPGSGSPLSLLNFFMWMSLHSAVILFIHPFVYKKTAARRFYQAYWILTNGAYIAFSILAMPKGFFFLFLIPVMISNFVTIAYIATHHGNSPMTAVNDPLVNTVTVRNPRWIEALHVQFSFHAEHHMFPQMNPRYTPLVNALLKERFPEKFQEMPHWKAVLRLYRTARFYRDPITHVNPRTLATSPTLLHDYLATEEHKKPATVGA